MHKDDALKKMCPHMLLALKTSVMALSNIPEITGPEYADALDAVDTIKLSNCRGPSCMMWQPDHGEYGDCGLKS